MGWSTGSSLMNEMITIIEDHVPQYSARVDIFKDMIRSFEDYDADTLGECVEDNDSSAFKEAYKSIYGENYIDFDPEDLD